MKKYFFIIFILICFNSVAQHSVSSNYTNNYIGQDFDINYNFAFKKSKVNFGISFLINRKWQNHPNWEAYYKIFHAFTFIDRLGYKVGYTYMFPLKNDKTSFYAFYDLRYRYGQTRGLIPVSTLDSLGNLTEYYTLRDATSTKIHAFANIIGGGVETKLFSNLFINAKIGAGFDSFYTTNKKHNDNSLNYYGNFPKASLLNLSYLFSIGLEYKFIKKAPNKTYK